jgi:hypothetical protein
MPRVGFEPTIPAFERANTVHALDRAANVIDPISFIKWKKKQKKNNTLGRMVLEQ